MPDRLVVRPLTDSLVVQWVPNRRSKYIVRGYYLGYGKGIPDVFRQVFDADTFFYTIENLRKYTYNGDPKLFLRYVWTKLIGH